MLTCLCKYKCALFLVAYNNSAYTIDHIKFIWLRSTFLDKRFNVGYYKKNTSFMVQNVLPAQKEHLLKPSWKENLVLNIVISSQPQELAADIFYLTIFFNISVWP